MIGNFKIAEKLISDGVIVVGIDPGIKHIGFALISMPERKLIWSDTVNNHVGIVPSDIDMLYQFQGNEPLLVCIEEPFAGVNVRDYGKTKEVVGMLKDAIFYADCGIETSEIMNPTPQAGNMRLGISGKDAKKTDKAKREAAARLGYTVANGHEASALAAALAGWDKYCVEVLDNLPETEDEE
jgi:Holliday junction resolvasome RuvABC endonuclease subunit